APGVAVATAWLFRHQDSARRILVARWLALWRAEGSTSLLPCGATLPGRMSRVCAICGKKPSSGNNRSHSMVATKRRFNPNLQRVRLVLDGKPTRDYVCTRCLKAGKVQKAV